MAANKQTAPPARLSSMERRAAHLATLANQQSELKREAAERREQRARETDSQSTSAPGKPAGASSKAR